MSDEKKYRSFTGILYPDSTSYDYNEKLALLEGCFNEWAYVLHDKDKNADGTDKKPHYHWVGYRKNAVLLKTIAKTMDLPENDIEFGKFGWRPLVRYLTHIDYPLKAPYTVDVIKGNFDVSRFMVDEVTSEDMARGLFNYLMTSGCTSVRQLVRWSFDNACFSELRRSFSLYQSVMTENKVDFENLNRKVEMKGE